MTQTKVDRTGEVGYNNQGLRMEIVRYGSARDIDVKFDNGYVAQHKRYDRFKLGIIKNLYFPFICDVGYIGEGKFLSSINGRDVRSYGTWRNMLRRCYDKKIQSKFPTYIGCSVDEQWHNYQNFAKWYYENYYEIDNEIMCLDKDILIKHNRIYCPKTCVFTPNRINALFIRNNNKRGNYPIGVCYDKSCDKLRAQIYEPAGISKHLGCFDTVKEAFSAYKIAKETYIKEVADEYKGKIPQKLYDAMYRYEVEIDD